VQAGGGGEERGEDNQQMVFDERTSG